MTDTKNLLICCTGSVASLKIPALITRLFEEVSDLSIKVVATQHALHFFEKADIPESVHLLTEEDEWSSWKKKGDPVLHIELRRWAHVLLVAPCDANTIAKMANGICDNLLTCVVRAWDMNKPLVFCPAMNTAMWEHPLTMVQLDKLRGFGYKQLGPISKLLACGDKGIGAMSEVENIIELIRNHLEIMHLCL